MEPFFFFVCVLYSAFYCFFHQENEQCLKPIIQSGNNTNAYIQGCYFLICFKRDWTSSDLIDQRATFPLTFQVKTAHTNTGFLYQLLLYLHSYGGTWDAQESLEAVHATPENTCIRINRVLGQVAAGSCQLHHKLFVQRHGECGGEQATFLKIQPYYGRGSKGIRENQEINWRWDVINRGRKPYCFC